MLSLFGPGHDHGGDTIFDVWKNSSVEMFFMVMSWVLISVIVFELINYFWKDSLSNLLKKSGKNQVAIATLMGVIPGCGGTLFLLPSYNKRELSFSALTAAFISTMGEVAFVLLAFNPMVWLWITTISIITALVVGYTLELTGLGKKIEQKIPFKKVDYHKTEFDSHHCEHHNEENKKYKQPEFITIINSKILPIATVLIYAITAPIVWQFTVGSSKDYGAYNTFSNWLGFVWINLLVLWYLFKKALSAKYDIKRVHIHESNDKASIIHHLEDAFETFLFITTWVLYGTLIVNMAILGFGEQNINALFLAIGPFLAMLLASIFGLIPGCGPQLIVTSLYMGGFVGGSALAANAIVQDGDAGLPLAAYDKKSYIYTQIVSMLPALLTGTTLVLIQEFTKNGLPF